MCVIINIEDGKFPKSQTLKDAESLNSHGGSIAWLEKGKINYRKGLKAKKIIKIIEKRLIPNKVKTAIIHFRIASVGNVNPKLCHPFPISKEVKTDLHVDDSKFDLLFHNGTISNWEKMLIKSIQDNPAKIPKGELSDSRVIAFLLNRHGNDIIKDSQMNKFSILTHKGIVKFGTWVKVDDNQCSNDYFVKKSATTNSTFNYDNAWYGGYGDYDTSNYGVWVNGKKKEKSKETEKNLKDTISKQALTVYKEKRSINSDHTNEQIKAFLKTKTDLKYYDLCVKEFQIQDDEILDRLCDGLQMIDIYDLFEDIYGNASRWIQDGDSVFTPAWEQYYK